MISFRIVNLFFHRANERESQLKKTKKIRLWRFRLRFVKSKWLLILAVDLHTRSLQCVLAQFVCVCAYDKTWWCSFVLSRVRAKLPCRHPNQSFLCVCIYRASQHTPIHPHHAHARTHTKANTNTNTNQSWTMNIWLTLIPVQFNIITGK